MDKLIITVTTDGTFSYPENPNNTHCDDTKGVAEEYIRSMNAGASIMHTHGQYRSDPVIQPDGRKLQIAVFEGWHDIVGRIREHGDPIIQLGLASMRLEEKLQLWKEIRPDMSSINFNSHDEYFQPNPDYPPTTIYAVHPISELREYARLAIEYGVKLEIECFNTGAFWAIRKMREGSFWTDDGVRELEPGLMPDPLWATLFFGWAGQGWTPPTARGLQYMVDHLPENVNWNISCMQPPDYWQLIAHAIGLGGHIRIGMEDCPYLSEGVYARTNAELIEKAVRLAREIGREIATAEEARAMIGIER
ncbi:MAG: 3-keto-5-aminohexanoate cleavage protein [Caldilineaceae bacterium SB0665_bin_21]|nr:3-keto-5-aminohexanoate cleavage protein [Caldilineaceae bacterium SB0665_bin_21]MYA04136.1 3-keto-5-aminohexanoate cleavage protein [Caldilineaceae bacterium SB0664_bin_22]MYC61503.1 3-keto-5-aminohexanoate cleavage protein [Caldilineaceae bacterium SB0661_bin_34]